MTNYLDEKSCAPMFSVLIVNYNSGEKIGRCLRHLLNQTWTDFETVIVDNASQDDSAHIAEAAAPRARLIKSETNLGFAAANNLAAAEAVGCWLVFLNPDAYPHEDWLENLAAGITKYPFADAFGSTQLCSDKPAIIDGAGDAMHVLGIPYRGNFGWPVESLPDEGECFAPCGAAATYRASTFRALGGFDKRFFCYGEDVDLGFRLRLAGGRSIQLKSARVLHEGSGITGRHSDFTVYHGNRNRIWLTYKCMPGAIYWPLLPARVMADVYLCIRAAIAGRGASYFRSVRDGYAGLKRFSTDRRSLQRGRRVGVAQIAAALTWSPLKLSRREADLRPIAEN